MLSKQRLDDTFKLFDKDGSGSVTSDELRNIFGMNVGNEIWQKIIEEVDQNGDGQVNPPVSILYPTHTRSHFKNSRI